MNLFQKWQRKFVHQQRSTKKKTKTKMKNTERRALEVEKDDFLLSQIDEFREKAKQLQNLLSSRESKVQELQDLVTEREGKAEELDGILKEKQSQADNLTRNVEQHIDGLIEKVDEKLDLVNQSIDEKLTDNLTKTSETTESIKTLVEETKAELLKSKNEILDKIHAEDVQCFRNIKEELDTLYHKLDDVEEIQKATHGTKGYLKVLTWFSMINFVVLIAFILYTLGVFQF